MAKSSEENINEVRTQAGVNSMVGQNGQKQKVTKYGQPYQSKGTQMVQNGKEGKFGKSQRSKKSPGRWRSQCMDVPPSRALQFRGYSCVNSGPSLQHLFSV